LANLDLDKKQLKEAAKMAKKEATKGMSSPAKT